jgi:hypothetical protein
MDGIKMGLLDARALEDIYQIRSNQIMSGDEVLSNFMLSYMQAKGKRGMRIEHGWIEKEMVCSARLL